MTRQYIAGRWTAAWLLMMFVAAPGSASATTDDDLKRDVENRLSKEEVVGFSVEVAVRGDEVTLRGEVPALWHKEWAIDRTRDTRGVVSVVSYLTIRNGESEAELARATAEAIRRYPYYTVFDDVSGTVKDSIVTLRGVVTPHPDKPADLYERVSRVPGVKGIVNEIEVLSPGIGDQRIRAALARRLFGHPSFDRYLGLNSSLNIIVRNGYVTLKGVVYSEADRLQADSIARSTFGVIRVKNELRTRQELVEATRHHGSAGSDE